MTFSAHVWDVLALLLAAGAYLYVRRHGGGAAMAELERANRILERRVGELERLNVEQAGELSVLRTRTDVAAAVAPVLAGIERHEHQATERAAKMLVVLDLLARRLGPDPDDV